MKVGLLSGVAVLSTMLVGCGATNVKDAEFCQNNNWEKRGELIAMKGASVRLFDKYVKQCDDMKSEEDKSAFQRGYYKGVKIYCTYENGYKLGKNSKPMKNICPYELSGEFEQGFKKGRRKLEMLKQEIDVIGDTQGAEATMSNSTSSR